MSTPPDWFIILLICGFLGGLLYVAERLVQAVYYLVSALLSRIAVARSRAIDRAAADL